MHLKEGIEHPMVKKHHHYIIQRIYHQHANPQYCAVCVWPNIGSVCHTNNGQQPLPRPAGKLQSGRPLVATRARLKLTRAIVKGNMDGDNDVTRRNNEHDSESISELPSCKDDLASVKPTLFQQLERKAPADGINWKRLKGYRLPTDDKKKVSWIWKHG
jgi:hypothetical protein